MYLSAQTFTSFFTGSTEDAQVQALGGICMMGGATEDDEAMKWFLRRAPGGDILVLRASGSDGYNNYLFSELGETVNSVESIVCHSPAASQEAYIQEKIQKAEAIWFAGGDQWKYISYWRNTAIDSLINVGIRERNIAVGGTSAGMAIMGGYYFTAQMGTITSGIAIADPYDQNMTLSSDPFIENNILSDVITDTHYDARERRGRHITFLARFATDSGTRVRGIACDEFTAVCIDTNGIASVYGQFPAFDDNAYFIQTNCALEEWTPELCDVGYTLDWNRGGEALRVFAVKGTAEGTGTFDLNTWNSGENGFWEFWYVDFGFVTAAAGSIPDCVISSSDDAHDLSHVRIYPNPSTERLFIKSDFSIEQVYVFDPTGSVSKDITYQLSGDNSIAVSDWSVGLYFLRVHTTQSVEILSFVRH